MIKILNILLFLFFSVSYSVSQMSLNGLWKGISYSKTINDTDAQIIYLSNNKYKNLLEAMLRFEIPSTLKFSTMKLQGNYKDSMLLFDKITLDKRNSSDFLSDKLTLTLKYIDSSGYLIGEIRRATDQIVVWNIVLFHSDGSINNQENKEVNHSWYYQFKREYSSGMVAPILREIERKNFKFQSVYFEPKEWKLEDRYHNYLKKIINVVNGHTDLRLKVIGHTDWNGTDEYNEDLSKKRAEVIIHFLQQNGLSRDRIEYEFRGEKNPIDNNKTPEGRKKNRRVDFEFI